MKLALIGAGARTALLVSGLIRRRDRLALREVSLHDVDPKRLAVMGRFCELLARRSKAAFTVHAEPDARKALGGADFVFSAIRVGQERGRVIDEEVPLRHGVVGQETTGPGGFAMAMRTIPVMLEYARLIQDEAPDAWLVNFTNPAGLVTQALRKHSNVKAVGVCDSPTSMRRSIAAVLAAPEAEVYLDYIGLNHLGWVRRVLVDGTDELPWLIAHYDRLREASPEWRLFEPSLVRSIGMLPNEYLYYFYYREQAVRHIRRSGGTRALELQALNGRLWRELDERTRASDFEGALRVYEHALAGRSRTYMQRESGAQPGSVGTDPTGMEEDGYEGLALALMTAVAEGSRPTLILNSPNRGSVDGLRADDVVEVPSVVCGHDVLPLAGGAVPDPAAALMHAVKVYERLTVEAAVSASYETAVRALCVHPLVASYSLAKAILDDYRRLHPELGHLAAERFAGEERHDETEIPKIGHLRGG